MLMWDGSCIVHEEFKAQELGELISGAPEAEVLAHPESNRRVFRPSRFC